MSEKDEKLNKGSFLYINDEEKAEWGYPEGYPSKSVQTTTLMEEQEIAFTLAEGAVYTVVLTAPPDIAEGQTYTVNWDGTEYKCICGAIDVALYIGNSTLMGASNDTGEPFIYVYNKNISSGQFATFDTSASHTISVKRIEGAVTPMASAFLPQATQTTYGAIKKAVHVPHVTQAPTSNDFNKLLSALREAGIMSQLE